MIGCLRDGEEIVRWGERFGDHGGSDSREQMLQDSFYLFADSRKNL